jgi:hypothetical protein
MLLTPARPIAEIAPPELFAGIVGVRRGKGRTVDPGPANGDDSPHIVPLSTRALELIRQLRELSGRVEVGLPKPVQYAEAD